MNMPEMTPEIPIEQFEIFATGLDHPECCAFDRDGNLWAGGEAGQIYRIDSAGRVETVANVGGFCCGLAFSPDDHELFVCVSGVGVVRVSKEGEHSVFATHAGQHRIVAPNYLLFDSRGRLYVTDSGNWMKRNGFVLRFDADGQGEIVAGPLGYANGMALSADGRQLFMVESDSDSVLRFEIGDDDRLSEPHVYASEVGRFPDGLALDADGNLYVCCYASDEIWRVSPEWPEGAPGARPLGNSAGPADESGIRRHGIRRDLCREPGAVHDYQGEDRRARRAIGEFESRLRQHFLLPIEQATLKGMPRLANKVAIVTGAAHGIGRAIAELFAEEGAWVLVADIDREAGEAVIKAIRDAGGNARFAPADVATEADVENAVAIAAEMSDRIDVLVNNAAHLGDWFDVQQATPEQWDRSFAVTLKGAANFTRAVLPTMTAQKSGSIINIASIQGLVAGRSSAVYTSMKHAVVGLTRSTAVDFGPHGIRANAICPGTDPNANQSAPKAAKCTSGKSRKRCWLARASRAKSPAAALFLASDESSYITGAVLPVDGGWTAF